MPITYLVESGFTVRGLIENKLLSNVEGEEFASILGLYGNKRNTPINYVGLIETPDQILFAFPKFDISSNKDNAKLIIDLMRRISAETDSSKKPADAHLFDQQRNEGSISRVGIASFLLEDFYQNGLLTIRRSYYKRSQNRKDWTKTIHSVEAILTDCGPVYDTWLSRHAEQVSHKIITEVHRAVITRCSSLYGELLGYPDAVVLGSSTNSSIGATGLPVLKILLRRTFNARETLVIKALIAWIEEGRRSGVRFFGTQYFHTIWETICAELFSDVKSSDEWASVMPYPEWVDWENNEQFYSPRSFVLDALTELPNNEGIVLIDAKYYLIKLNDGKVQDGPGINDISKQLHYEELIFTSSNFISRFGNDRALIINCFVFPTGNDECELMPTGEISIPRITKNRVVCVNLSGNLAIRRYLKREPFSQAELMSFSSSIKSIPSSFL
jgi:LlaJI restriction endonuclease